jgi:hypothetical protein
MPAPAPKLLLIDPLTMLGRELEALLPALPALAEGLRHLHSGTEDEHQIAELGGAPALVPALNGPEDLEGSLAIVLAAEADSPRLDHLEAHLARCPDTPLVVMGTATRFARRCRPAVGLPGEVLPGSQVRVPHASAVAAALLLAPLRHLDPVSLTVAALEPVSAFGSTGVDALAAQAARRLQGGESEESIDGRTLAFNLVTVDAGDLAADLGALLPDLEIAATRAVLGVFHGHVAHLTLRFAEPRRVDEVEGSWQGSGDLALVEQASLNDVAERDRVFVTRPRLSDGRRTLAVTAMADGLRIGGALTAIRLLTSMIAGR